MSVLDSIFNHSERLVVDEIALQAKGREFSEEQLGDIACLALNQVPSKYIKHSIDRAFYMSDEERRGLDENVTEAVKSAIQQVASDKDGV